MGDVHPQEGNPGGKTCATKAQRKTPEARKNLPTTSRSTGQAEHPPNALPDPGERRTLAEPQTRGKRQAKCQRLPDTPGQACKRQAAPGARNRETRLEDLPSGPRRRSVFADGTHGIMAFTTPRTHRDQHWDSQIATGLVEQPPGNLFVAAYFLELQDLGQSTGK